MKSFDEFIEKSLINETSLSRVWQHFTNDNTVVILTAFRGDKTTSENIRNNISIAKELKTNKFGYFFVDGYWIENEGEEDEKRVSEDSILCVTNDENSDKLIDLAHLLANKHNQDAIFVKTKNEVYLLFKNGSKDVLSKGFTPDKLGSVYTKLRNNKKANTFVFEGARDSYGFLGHLAASNASNASNASDASSAS